MNDRHNSTLWTRAAALALMLGLAGLGAAPSSAQTESFAIPDGAPPHSASDLETLVGPIALYPDDLIGIVLPASTYPLQIVQASRFLDQRATDPSLEPDDEWDDAVVALLNYPEVLALMNEQLDWTWALGEAVLSQQTDVMDAIQRFRNLAYSSGNLSSDERQVVTSDGEVIEIAPADPEVIYIPYYEPAQVVVVQPRRAYYYYPRPYPVYYYPYPLGYEFGFHFGRSFFWGVTSIFDIGWHNHLVHVYHHRHYLHPYYAYSYYAPYYARRSVSVNINLNQSTYAWQPREHRAARPLPGRGRVVTNREGYADGRAPATFTSGNRGVVSGSRVVRDTGRVGARPQRDAGTGAGAGSAVASGTTARAGNGAAVGNSGAVRRPALAGDTKSTATRSGATSQPTRARPTTKAATTAERTANPAGRAVGGSRLVAPQVRSNSTPQVRSNSTPQVRSNSTPQVSNSAAPQVRGNVALQARTAQPQTRTVQPQSRTVQPQARSAQAQPQARSVQVQPQVTRQTQSTPRSSAPATRSQTQAPSASRLGSARSSAMRRER